MERRFQFYGERNDARFILCQKWHSLWARKNARNGDETVFVYIYMWTQLSLRDYLQLFYIHDLHGTAKSKLLYIYIDSVILQLRVYVRNIAIMQYENQLINSK